MKKISKEQEFEKLGFSKNEIAVFKKLGSPAKVQDFLDNEISYNLEEEGETSHSPKMVLLHKKAHCLEGAVFAAACLYFHNFKPLLLDLSAIRDDDHVIAVFKQNSRWGAVGQSKFSTLRFREPVFLSTRELVMSYFEHYFNYSKEKTLRKYSVPLNLMKFGKEWMVSDKPIDFISNELEKSTHFKILQNGAEKILRKVADYNFKSEILIKPKNFK